ncbi:TIGR03084 family metal-binding protein [Rhodococcus tibetensis]|uniref:TIGR03084 family metal-binding protein n=1 Tax=Rhodococcus tibetensis TaxID=2965064 RepID=A0ABT1QGD2_9NOCA|nr:TIGR03084 family metal-binding protein [Rhodococcus sp. FXJ9.536]MCQ4121308.1 TIGR03084 family metal-binding protein [Rhodococcus sp. FXJ9.536]
MAELQRFIDDVCAESESLDALVADLPDSRWADPTPAEGWTIAHQIGHLLWTDRAALLAITDPDGFTAQVTDAAADPAGFVDAGAQECASLPPAELLAEWRATRERLADALGAVPPDRKILWYGPPMKAASMATARLMETWAHGQDVADALGVARTPTARLRSIAHLGVRTRDFAYAVNGLTPPAEEFRVELTAPDGVFVWTWGPEDAAQKVTGPAEDFCLLVTQRANRADLALVATGPNADEWLDIAQAFAGPAGDGRKAGTR